MSKQIINHIGEHSNELEKLMVERFEIVKNKAQAMPNNQVGVL